MKIKMLLFKYLNVIWEQSLEAASTKGRKTHSLKNNIICYSSPWLEPHSKQHQSRSSCGPWNVTCNTGVVNCSMKFAGWEEFCQEQCNFVVFGLRSVMYIWLLWKKIYLSMSHCLNAKENQKSRSNRKETD